MKKKECEIEPLHFKNFKVLHKFKSIESTNDYLKDEKISAGTVCISEIQTKGKGKHGAKWFSQKGGLWFSFVLNEKFENTYFYVILSSVAVSAALEEYGIKPFIKWPNDIMVNQKKICGILIEKDAYNKKIVTGIGININNRLPEDPSINATSLKMLKIKSSPEEMFKKTLSIVDNLLNTRSERKVIKEWIKRQFALEGKTVKIMKKGIMKNYIVKGITKNGTLKVTDENGKVKTIEGEIFFK